MTLLGIQDMARALARSGLRAKEICRAIDCHPLTARAAIRAVRARGDHLVSGGDRAGLDLVGTKIHEAAQLYHLGEEQE